MNIPQDLKFAATHEWIRPLDGRVGVSHHAQAELSDVVYVELPAVGARVEAGAACAVVESVKAAADIYAPASGTVTAVNAALAQNPGLLNSDPYGEGWLFAVALETPGALAALQDAAAYAASL